MKLLVPVVFLVAAPLAVMANGRKFVLFVKE